MPRTRKERGHFGTAPAIADFMAGMFTQIAQGPVRILDPGAGVGTLSAAVCQRIRKAKLSLTLKSKANAPSWIDSFRSREDLVESHFKVLTRSSIHENELKLTLEALSNKQLSGRESEKVG